MTRRLPYPAFLLAVALVGASGRESCAETAPETLEVIAARVQAEGLEESGRRYLAAGRPRAARKEFLACLTEAVDGRVREACRRGLDKATLLVKNGSPESPPKPTLYMAKFKAGSTEPTKEWRARLASLGDLFRYYPLDSIVLTAFVQARTTAATSLAERRLESTRTALTAAGTKAEQIRISVEVGTGKADVVRIAITEGEQR